MTGAKIAGGAFAILLVLLALAAGLRALRKDSFPAVPPAPTAPAADAPAEPALPPAGNRQGFLYGRIAVVEGGTYEGRLRFGGGQEAFWGDYFNGAKAENPWAAHVAAERLPTEDDPIEVFGLRILERRRPIDLGRRFMARFGDIARIEARGRDVRVVLKSGAAFDLDRLEASDFDDGVRVWDARRGTVDLDSLRIRRIELLPSPAAEAPAYRLQGTVLTHQGEFSGFVQWDREECVGSDQLDGYTAGGKKTALRFDTLRSIARRGDGVVATLLDGRQIEVSGSGDTGPDNRGLYVDDPRYGRVLVSWEAFERVDFRAGESGPGYSDFSPGGPLRGSVTTRAGKRWSGRLVYDLDESETSETLDAPVRGVDYTLPFHLVATIVPAGAVPNGEPGEPEGRRHARVTLTSGEVLQLESQGDLADGNAGLLVFPEGEKRPTYVPWSEVGRIDLDPPANASPGEG